MKQKLFIIDDELGLYFSFHHYEVLTAYGGKEALEKLAKQPDFILLDINMPDMNNSLSKNKGTDYLPYSFSYSKNRIC